MYLFLWYLISDFFLQQEDGKDDYVKALPDKLRPFEVNIHCLSQSINVYFLHWAIELK